MNVVRLGQINMDVYAEAFLYAFILAMPATNAAFILKTAAVLVRCLPCVEFLCI
jgi:hypothetical protein